MVADPVEILVSKSMSVQFAVIIFAILDRCPLIFQADIKLTYIIYDLRIDPVHLIDVRESVSSEIHITLRQRTGSRLCKSKVLHITQEQDSLPLLSIAQREP